MTNGGPFGPLAARLPPSGVFIWTKRPGRRHFIDGGHQAVNVVQHSSGKFEKAFSFIFQFEMQSLAFAAAKGRLDSGRPLARVPRAAKEQRRRLESARSLFFPWTC